MHLVWSESARRDVRSQILYLAERNPAAARRAQAAIRATVERLADHPLRGRPGRRENTRELVITGLPYVVIYAVGETVITILRVLHASQDWRSQAE